MKKMYILQNTTLRTITLMCFCMKFYKFLYNCFYNLYMFPNNQSYKNHYMNFHIHSA